MVTRGQRSALVLLLILAASLYLVNFDKSIVSSASLGDFSSSSAEQPEQLHHHPPPPSHASSFVKRSILQSQASSSLESQLADEGGQGNELRPSQETTRDTDAPGDADATTGAGASSGGVTEQEETSPQKETSTTQTKGENGSSDDKSQSADDEESTLDQNKLEQTTNSQLETRETSGGEEEETEKSTSTDPQVPSQNTESTGEGSTDDQKETTHITEPSDQESDSVTTEQESQSSSSTSDDTTSDTSTGTESESSPEITKQTNEPVTSEESSEHSTSTTNEEGESSSSSSETETSETSEASSTSTDEETTTNNEASSSLASQSIIDGDTESTFSTKNTDADSQSTSHTENTDETPTSASHGESTDQSNESQTDLTVKSESTAATDEDTSTGTEGETTKQTESVNSLATSGELISTADDENSSPQTSDSEASASLGEESIDSQESTSTTNEQGESSTSLESDEKTSPTDEKTTNIISSSDDSNEVSNGGHENSFVKDPDADSIGGPVDNANGVPFDTSEDAGPSADSEGKSAGVDEETDGVTTEEEQIVTSPDSESPASDEPPAEKSSEDPTSPGEDAATSEETSPAEASSTTEDESPEKPSTQEAESSPTESETTNEQTETTASITSEGTNDAAVDGATGETDSNSQTETTSGQSQSQAEEKNPEQTSNTNEEANSGETASTGAESSETTQSETSPGSTDRETSTSEKSETAEPTNKVDSDGNSNGNSEDQSSLINDNNEEIGGPGASDNSNPPDAVGPDGGEGDSGEGESDSDGTNSEADETTESIAATSETATESAASETSEASPTTGSDTEESKPSETTETEVDETAVEVSSETTASATEASSQSEPEEGTTDATTSSKEQPEEDAEKAGSEAKLESTEGAPNSTDETESATGASSEEVSTGGENVPTTAGGEETESTETDQSTGGESTSASPSESETGGEGEATSSSPESTGTSESSPESEEETTAQPGQTSSGSPQEETTTINDCGSEHGCCGDGKTPAKGPEQEGCTCDASKFGCCPDRLTAAKGPHNEGCPCQTMQYGCCPNSTQTATGTKYAGCPCNETPHGCCPDGKSVAFGPNYKGCQEGEPMDTRLSGEACALPKERGPGRNYTVNWYFDMTYGGCIRFWYGGREGNANRFQTQEECERTCVSPEGAEVCPLPKVEGPCDGRYPSFYFNKQSGKCETFDYGGCLGNKNRFDTKEACEEVCHSKPTSEDPCDQPVVVGPCRGNLWRWYFNKQEGKCKSFVYGGCDGNKNNFKSEADCMSTCSAALPGELCKLGKAEGPCLGHYPRWFYDYLDSSCKEFIYSGCEGNRNQFVDKSSCERTCNQTQVVAKTDVCDLPMDKGPCGGNMLRWHFNKRTRRCEAFTFGGCEGNINNFGSQSDCERACLVATQEQNVCLLPRNPGNCTRNSGYDFEEERWYYDLSDKRCHRMYYSGCNGNGNNFRSHDECFTRCGEPFAPSVQNVDLTQGEFKTEYCSLPRDPGPCKMNEIKWWYDKSDGVCKEFYFGGCNGNFNRFNSKRECELKCWNSQNICNLKKVRGPCSGNFIQWYFDRTRNSCVDFAYSGCSGNANRFSAKETCESYCKKKHVTSLESENAIASMPPQKDPSCSAPVDPGTCQSYLPFYYYDHRENLCRTFIYTGCGGNVNRFESKRECEKRCVTNTNDDGPDESDDKEVVCKAQVEAGPCMDSHARWFYDPTSYTCLPFIYGGCGGNKNRFKTFEVCIKFCSGVNNHRPEVTQSPLEFTYEEPTRNQRPIVSTLAPVTQVPIDRLGQSSLPQQTSWPVSPVTSVPTTTTTQDPCRYECADSPFFDDCELFVTNRYCNNPGYAKVCCKSCVTSGQLDLDAARQFIIGPGASNYVPRDEGRRWCFYEN